MQDYIHAENIVLILDMLKTSLNAITRNFQLLSTTKRCPKELSREVGIVLWSMSKFSCAELSELGALFMGRYNLSKSSFASLPGRGTQPDEGKRIADITINPDLQRLFGPIFTPLTRPSFESVFSTLQGYFIQMGLAMPEALAEQITAENSPEYARRKSLERSESVAVAAAAASSAMPEVAIATSQCDSSSSANSSPPLVSPRFSGSPVNDNTSGITSPIASEQNATKTAGKKVAGVGRSKSTMTRRSPSPTRGGLKGTHNKQRSPSFFNLFRRPSMSGTDPYGPPPQAAAAAAAAPPPSSPPPSLAVSTDTEFDGMSMMIAASGAPTKTRVVSEQFPLEISESAYPLDFGLTSHKAPVDKDLCASFTIANRTAEKYEVWVEHPFEETLKYKFELKFLLDDSSCGCSSCECSGCSSSEGNGNGNSGSGNGSGSSDPSVAAAAADKKRPLGFVIEPSAVVCVHVRARFFCTANVCTEYLVRALHRHKKVHKYARFPVELGSQLSIKLDKDEVVKSVVIGEGSYGRVYRGKYRGQDVAIKELLDLENPDTATDFFREVDIMKDLRHNAIVSLVGAVFTEGSYAILTEFCRFGSLDSAIQKYPDKFGTRLRVKCLYDCACGMNYLHQSNIVHRDLKPENILVVSLDPDFGVACKISDFGTTRDLSPNSAAMSKTKGVGTPVYMAPEILDGCSKYTSAVDVYSFALTMYNVFEEKIPYSDISYSSPWEFAKMVVNGSVKKICVRWAHLLA